MSGQAETAGVGAVDDRSDAAERMTCWVCGATALRMIKRGNLPDVLTPDAVRISDANYGVTADIYACRACGFMQCPTLDAVLSLYDEMDDDEYEATRDERALQHRALVRLSWCKQRHNSLGPVGACRQQEVHPDLCHLINRERQNIGRKPVTISRHQIDHVFTEFGVVH